MEQPMLEHLGLTNVVTVRASSSRPEIVYTVSPSPPVHDSAIPQAVASWFRTQLEKPLQSSKSQVLIYVPKKSIGVELAKTMGVPFFESGTCENEKVAIFNDFRHGRLQTLVATAAFGAGIDIPTVDLVIHAGSPRSLVDFAQESGRAGREGLWGMSTPARWRCAIG
jgi:superfamily II DNA helicase RecQ